MTKQASEESLLARIEVESERRGKKRHKRNHEDAGNQINDSFDPSGCRLFRLLWTKGQTRILRLPVRITTCDNRQTKEKRAVVDDSTARGVPSVNRKK